MKYWYVNGTLHLNKLNIHIYYHITFRIHPTRQSLLTPTQCQDARSSMFPSIPKQVFLMD